MWVFSFFLFVIPFFILYFFLKKSIKRESNSIRSRNAFLERQVEEINMVLFRLHESVISLQKKPEEKKPDVAPKKRKRKGELKRPETSEKMKAYWERRKKINSSSEEQPRKVEEESS